jgi:hypothetical protein
MFYEALEQIIGLEVVKLRKMNEWTSRRRRLLPKRKKRLLAA